MHCKYYGYINKEMKNAVVKISYQSKRYSNKTMHNLGTRWIRAHLLVNRMLSG